MCVLQMNNRKVRFKIDTGADVSVIPHTLYSRRNNGQLQKVKTSLVGPSQELLKVKGSFNTTIQNGEIKSKETIYVVEGLRLPLVGRSAIMKLNLLSEVNAMSDTLEEVKTMFPELFNGLGLMKGEYRIKLQEGAKPFSITIPRRVPVPLLPKVKRELENMEQKGVISKVTEASDWCAGMVVVPKPNGKVRICIDLTKLNQYVLRERHILPSVDHVLAQIGDTKYFSKLHANLGFWQIELSPESSMLTTFITPFGRYRFNRLPFGISSAPEVFQIKVSEILGDMEGVVGLIDDLLVYGRSKEEHDERLRKVLQKLRESGATLNEDKRKFFNT